METDTDSGCEDSEELQLRQQRGHSLVVERDKGGAGVVFMLDILCSVVLCPPVRWEFPTNNIVPGLNGSANNPLSQRKYSSTFNQYKLPEFSHVKSKVDTGR